MVPDPKLLEEIFVLIREVGRQSGGLLDPERSVSIDEAARFLGVGKRSLYRWRQEGILPAYKIGERLIFRRVDLIQFRERFRERSKL